MRTSNLAALTQNSLKAARFGDSQDSWRWGIVISLNPVAVRLDGETSPVFPSDVLSKVTVGDRVLVRIAGMAATVMGSDSGQHQPVEVDVEAKCVVRPGVYPDGRLDPPAGLSGACRSGMVSISWPGKLSRLGGVPYLPPANFDHIVLQQSDTKTGDWTDIGMCTSGGLTLDRQDKVGSSLWFRGVSVDIKGKRFEASQPFEVPISNQLATDVANAMTAADEAGKVAAKNQETLTSKLGEFQTTLDGVTSSVNTVTQSTASLHNQMVSVQQAIADIPATDVLGATVWTDGWSCGALMTKSPADAPDKQIMPKEADQPDDTQATWIWTTRPVLHGGKQYEIRFPQFWGGGMPETRVYPFVVGIQDDNSLYILDKEDFPELYGNPVEWGKVSSWTLDLTRLELAETYGLAFSSEGKAFNWHASPVVYDITNQASLRGKLADAQQKADQAYSLAESKVDAAEVKTIVAESAGGGNHIVYANKTPDTDGKSVGDTWFARDSKGTVWGQWVWDGTQWQPAMIDSKVIASLDVGKLTAGTVVTPEAVIEKLWADGLNSRVVETQKVVVSPGNLWTDTDFSAPTQEWQDLVKNHYAEVGDFYDRRALHYIPNQATSGGLWRYAMSTPSGLGLVDTLVMECAVYTSSGSTPQIWFNIGYSEDGKTSALSRMSEEAAYVEKVYPKSWCRMRCELTNLDQNYRSGFLSLGVMHTEDVYISNVSVRAKTGTVLIEDGSITAGKLVVDESLIDTLTVSTSLWAGKISTEMLKVGDYVNGVAIDKYGVHIKGAGVVELSSGGFIAKDRHGATTVHIDSDGNAQFKGSIMDGSTISAPQIVGGVVTGARLQTSQTGQRIVIDGDTLTMYNTANVKKMQLDDDRLEFFNGNTKTGMFREINWTGKPTVRGVMNTLDKGDFICWDYIVSDNNPTHATMVLDKTGRATGHRGIVFFDDVWLGDTLLTSYVQSWANNAMSQASAAMNQASAAMRAANDVQNRLTRLWTASDGLFKTLNAYGFTTADGRTIGPGHFPSPSW